jgi:hypothetical protein
MPAASPGVMFFGFDVKGLVGDCAEPDGIMAFVGDVAGIVGGIWDVVGDVVGVAGDGVCVVEAAEGAVPLTVGVDTVFVTSKKLSLPNVTSVGL